MFSIINNSILKNLDNFVNRQKNLTVFASKLLNFLLPTSNVLAAQCPTGCSLTSNICWACGAPCTSQYNGERVKRWDCPDGSHCIFGYGCGSCSVYIPC